MVTARHDTEQIRFLGDDLRDVMVAMTITFNQAAGVRVGDLGSEHLAGEIERFRDDWRMGEGRIVDGLLDAVDFLRRAADAYEAIESSLIAAMGTQR